MVTYGGMSKKPMTIPVGQLIFQDLSYKGYWMTRWNQEHHIQERQDMLESIASLVSKGQFREPEHEFITLDASENQQLLQEQVTQTIERMMSGFWGKKPILAFK
jgi:trans-2-enoyl-CoA reductase